MPDGSEQSYDVFVSYAHADNEKPLGSAAQYGWITTLAHNLNTGPGHLRKNLFIDHRLKPGDIFSDDLVTTVGNSTLLLLLLSQNYIDSTWCGKELDHFIRTHANDPDKPTDVFVVELFPFETFAKVPANIHHLRKRLIHAQFWHQPADASAPLLAGDPSPQECGPDSVRHYWRKLHELRDAIDSRLRTLHRDQTAVSAALSTADAPTDMQRSKDQPELGTILLADVTEDLVPMRSDVKAALEPEGVVVLPEGDYVGLTPDEFKAEFARDLARCELFVQMVTPTIGRTGKGFTAPLPQLQFDGAVAAKKPIMQWCERLPGPGDITDPGHAKLFKTAYLRVTNRTSFEREILERLRAIRQATERDRKAAQAEQASVVAKKLIFIDDVAGGSDLNQRLRATLQSANYGIRSLPQDAPLGNNGIDIAQMLKPCHAGITIFADSAKRDTVFNRLIFFLNQIAEAHLPVSRWAIYVTVETKGYDLGLASDDLFKIDEQGLADFVRGLER